MIDNDYVTPHLFLKKNIIILCSGSSDKRQLTSWRQTSFCVYFHLCILNRTSVFKSKKVNVQIVCLCYMSCYGQNINFSKFFGSKANLISQLDRYNMVIRFLFEAYVIESMYFIKIRTMKKYCYSNNFDICTAIRKTLIKISHNRLLHNMICLRFSRLLSL